MYILTENIGKYVAVQKVETFTKGFRSLNIHFRWFDINSNKNGFKLKFSAFAIFDEKKILVSVKILQQATVRE